MSLHGPSQPIRCADLKRNQTSHGISKQIKATHRPNSSKQIPSGVEEIPKLRTQAQEFLFLFPLRLWTIAPLPKWTFSDSVRPAPQRRCAHIALIFCPRPASSTAAPTRFPVCLLMCMVVESKSTSCQWRWGRWWLMASVVNNLWEEFFTSAGHFGHGFFCGAVFTRSTCRWGGMLVGWGRG